MDMNSRRYSMAVRGASARDTRHAILAATFALASEKSSVEIVLAEIAERAGVTVKTVLRHFGSRDALFSATIDFASSEVEEERFAPVGDLDQAVRIVVDHYELRGDWVIRMLAQERSDARVHAVVERGREVHRQWVRTTFAPQLERMGGDPEATIDLLVVALDVYTWTILRRDRGLGREETEQRMGTLTRAIIGEERST